MKRALVWLGGACVAIGLATGATAQSSSTKKALVQRVLQSQQAEIENVAHSIVERPAAQMMQRAARAIQAAPADKREALGKAVEAEAHKYVDEAYPLVRERAMRIAPATVGAVLEAKMSEDELKQLVAWLDSPVSKKYQQLSAEMRDAFVDKLLAEAQPVVDPKLQALDARIRAILSVPRTPTAGAPVAAPARPGPPAKAASK
jgi:flagellum-specific peptidoglycan hydrolase FlgJ